VHYKLEADEKTALLIDGYTLSEHRGKGIYKAVWNYCLEYLRSRGDLDRIYGFILVKNKRSLIVHRKLQLQDIILVITYLRIFGVNLHFKKKISDSG
jgi:GNAT superfamily N-acetyltransferase